MADAAPDLLAERRLSVRGAVMNELRYRHLIGIPWDPNARYCYTLVRDFYRDNFGLELSDYPYPANWGQGFCSLDLFRDLAAEEDFVPVELNPREWKVGDVLVSAVESSIGNHCMIWLDNNRILHHLVGQLSCETAYGGIFRNNLVGVYRHKSAPRVRVETAVDFRTVLPQHVERRLEELRTRRGADGAAGPRT
jgi:cell wall-associated NlpC family hydrolase